MTNISVTGILREYKTFSRDFWLQYKALEAIMPEAEWNNVKMILLRTKRVGPEILAQVDIEAYELKKAEIDADWLQKSEEAKQEGITVHDMIRNAITTESPLCKDFAISTEIHKVQDYSTFLQNDGLYPEFRMEVKLDDEITLIGVADLIIKEGNKVKIIDYKTGQKIEMHAKYDASKKQKKSFKYPMSHIEDSKYNEYVLQISLYAWMLKALFPHIEIESLQLYHISDLKLKKIYNVDFLQKEVQKLLTWHVKQVKLKQEVEKCREIQY